MIYTLTKDPIPMSKVPHHDKLNFFFLNINFLQNILHTKKFNCMHMKYFFSEATSLFQFLNLNVTGYSNF